MKPSMRWVLFTELLLLFLLVPLALFLLPPFLPPMPLLWALAIYCTVTLRSDPTFQRTQLWNRNALPGSLATMLTLFSAAALLLTLLVWKFAPAQLFTLVRHHPVLWTLIMLLYPVLSVYPQGLVYRVFVMHRYRELVPQRQKETALILLSAACFAMMHLVFHNWVAIALTFPGGLLFAWRQQRTRSLLTSSVEHALYGGYLFSVGLGMYFYARLV
ncbi:CPBP family intramembrane glutamic endopeptidase [Silvibacterium sp.]|uniref:CPBP family intramembrane glutamic endopeptidase n=1 Tax=Silvibacterium sp. TaxID=1964179 RepID=UPI0039E2E968